MSGHSVYYWRINGDERERRTNTHTTVWQKAIDRRYYGNGFEDVEDVARLISGRAFLHAREMTDRLPS